MNTRMTILGLAIAGVASLSVSTVYADDTKVYAGTSCQAKVGAEEQYLDRTNPYITNTDAADHDVKCPVVTDNTSQDDGTDDAFVRVQSDGTATLTCTLCAYSLFGVDFVCETDSTTSATPVALDVDVDDSYERGYYELTCTLPANNAGKIFSYLIDEND